MTKKITFIVVALLLCIGGYSVYHYKNDDAKNNDLKQFLQSAGFNKVPGVIKYNSIEEKKYWFNKYGVYFITHDEMKVLCDSNNFIIAPCTVYKGSIPDVAIKEMQVNYNKIGDDMLKYNAHHTGEAGMLFTENETGWWLSNKTEDWYGYYNFLSDDLKDRLNSRGVKVLKEQYGLSSFTEWRWNKTDTYTKIQIVADSENFDLTGLDKNGYLYTKHIPKRDPIAVIQHRNGYIILAKW